MTAQKGNKAKYVLALLAALAAVLWMNVNTAHAAQKLALFNFETASGGSGGRSEGIFLDVQQCESRKNLKKRYRYGCKAREGSDFGKD